MVVLGLRQYSAVPMSCPVRCICKWVSCWASGVLTNKAHVNSVRDTTSPTERRLCGGQGWLWRWLLRCWSLTSGCCKDRVLLHQVLICCGRWGEALAVCVFVRARSNWFSPHQLHTYACNHSNTPKLSFLSTAGTR
jgi:hypothetical protein